MGDSHAGINLRSKARNPTILTLLAISGSKIGQLVYRTVRIGRRVMVLNATYVLPRIKMNNAGCDNFGLQQHPHGDLIQPVLNACPVQNNELVWPVMLVT
jgi:hypothetical protein